MADVLDVNKRSGSDCDFDVTNDDVRYITIVYNYSASCNVKFYDI
jgi:hypothetical protein